MLETKNVSFNTIAQELLSAGRIVVLAHVRPDGDALGSVLAVSHVLGALGKDVTGAVDSLKGLGGPGCLEGIDSLVEADKIEGSFDLALSLDCASVDRIAESVRPFLDTAGKVVNIDHHVTNTRFGTFNYVDADASSTGEIIWELFKAAEWPIDRLAAEALWVAMVTDTGRFAYDSTGPQTLACGSDLLTHGVRTSWLNDRLYCSFTQTSVELKRRAYPTLSYRPDGSVAMITLTGRDFAETGGTKADAEDVIEIPRSLVGNRVALFFYGNPEDENETRISIRTRAPLDASSLAMKFGGGGHLRAAGCTISAPMDEAKALFREALEVWLRESEEKGESK